MYMIRYPKSKNTTNRINISDGKSGCTKTARISRRAIIF